MSTKKSVVAKRPLESKSDLKAKSNSKNKIVVAKSAVSKSPVKAATVKASPMKSTLNKASLVAAKPTNSKPATLKPTVTKPVVAKPTAVKSVAKVVAKPVSITKSAPAKAFEIAKPLPPKKEEVFNTGDKVVYPAHGVGAIDSIQARIIGGTETRFYMITIMETGMKVMVPMAQANTVGLRKIVDVKTVEKVYGILKDKDVTVHQQTWNRRYREYTQKLKTGSVFEIATVIRDLSVLKGDKELSFGERKMLDTAQGLLVKEISIAKARPEDLIRAELQKICEA